MARAARETSVVVRMVEGRVSVGVRFVGPGIKRYMKMKYPKRMMGLGRRYGLLWRRESNDRNAERVLRLIYGSHLLTTTSPAIPSPVPRQVEINIEAVARAAS